MHFTTRQIAMFYEKSIKIWLEIFFTFYIPFTSRSGLLDSSRKYTLSIRFNKVQIYDFHFVNYTSPYNFITSLNIFPATEFRRSLIICWHIFALSKLCVKLLINWIRSLENVINETCWDIFLDTKFNKKIWSYNDNCTRISQRNSPELAINISQNPILTCYRNEIASQSSTILNFLFLFAEKIAKIADVCEIVTKLWPNMGQGLDWG